MEKREKHSKVIIIIFLAFFIWASLQFISPLLLPAKSVNDLSGIVVVSDNDITIDEMGFPHNVVYSIGDRLCHERAERSFFINGNQMPFCSRCTGIWVGLVIGISLMIFYTIKLDEKIFLLIVLSILPLGIDGAGQLIGFWESTNLIRLITGLLTGFGCGVAIGIIVDEFKAAFKETNMFKKV